jgi:hypothetical protein
LWLEKGLFCSKKRCPPRWSRSDKGEEGGVGRVIIGVDPHKLSATIEVLDDREKVLCGGRFGTDRDGYRQVLIVGRRWPDRVWAVERLQRHRPAPGPTAGRRRRAGRRRPGEAVGPGAGVLHRPWPQDRRH